jgi:hypothetical protein
MSVFGAVGRWLKAIGYLLTGRIDGARKVLDSNPNVMNAKYDEMISAMSIKIKQYIDAAAVTSSHVAKKQATLKTTDEEVARIEQLMNGAKNIGAQVAAKLQAEGKDPLNSVEYTQHRSAYNDFSSTLLEKKKMKKELEESIAQGEKTNRDNLSVLKSLQREYENLKKEKGEMVTRMIGANQERELKEMISGLSADTGNIGAERNKIREMVMEAEAGAKIAGQVAGTDARRAEEEYLEMAVRNAANSEFDAMIGVAKPVAVLPQSSPVIEVNPIVQTDSVTINR